MTAVSLDTTTAEKFDLPESFSWRDPQINCTLVVAQPSTEPELWSEFVTGAYRSYGKRGVECALGLSGEIHPDHYGVRSSRSPPGQGKCGTCAPLPIILMESGYRLLASVQ